MAKALNKNRMQESRFALIITLIIVLFSRQYWGEENIYHEIFEITGTILVGICALGRVYATTYLGGFKNEVLITHGIYSALRNPLYFFSLLGVTGIALMSNHLCVVIGLPLFFVVLYMSLIKREQNFLREKFGLQYEAYRQTTRALIPNFKQYHDPETLQINPRFVTKAFLDAVWWLAALPLIELVEYLQSAKILPVFFAS